MDKEEDVTNCVCVKWSDLIEHLRLYKESVLDLPDDHSIISPIAIVLSQKRRLIMIHELHNWLLETDENEAGEGGGNRFVLQLQEIIKNSHWNQWSKLEAQSIAALLTDSLDRCQAESKIINATISDTRNVIKSCLNQAYGKMHLEGLRSGLILLCSVMKKFNTEACQWASDVLKLCNEVFKLSHNRPETEDYCLECLKVLNVIFRLPKRFIDLKEKEKIPAILNQYMMNSVKHPLHALEAADVYEAMLENVSNITKGHVKTVLALLNCKLSSLLHDNNRSTKLLEHCFKLSPETSMTISLNLHKNIERVRRYPYIDPRYFAAALAQVVIDLNLSKEDQIKLFFVLLPSVSSTSKSFVSPKCFGDFVFSLIYRSKSYPLIIDGIQFIFKTLTDQLKSIQSDYFIEVLTRMTRLCRIYPEGLSNVDISDLSFALESKNESIQLKSIKLIYTVFKNSPTILSSQATLIFARVKGEFVRINLREDAGISLYSVEASLKMLAIIINRLLVKYSNYCDHVVLRRMVEWVGMQFSESKEERNGGNNVNGSNDNPRIRFALFLLATALSRYNHISVSSAVIEFMSKSSNGVYSPHFITFISKLIHENYGSGSIDLYSPVLNQCLHLLNIMTVQDLIKSRVLKKLMPVTKMCIENKFINADLVDILAKSIAYYEYSETDADIFEDEFDLLLCDGIKGNKYFLTQSLECFAKLFWRTSLDIQHKVLTQWIECLKSKKSQVPHQILLATKAILYSYDMEIVSNNHAVILLEKVQLILKHFILDQNFDVRIECGVVFGILMKFIMHVDTEREQYMEDLFKQMMHHAISTSDSEQKSRVCYIVGVVTMKSHLQLSNIRLNTMDLDTSTLLGLLASWSRESRSNSIDGVGDDIIAVTILEALSISISNSGFLWGIDLFRDTCELVLEQVFMKRNSDKMVRSIEGIIKNLAFFANIVNDSLHIIFKTIRLILESEYNNSGKIDLLYDISQINPKLSNLSPKMIKSFMFSDVKSSSSCRKMCSYLNRQIEFDDTLAFKVLDSGLLVFLLKNMENDGSDTEISRWLQKMMSITLLERFNYWNENVFARMTFNYFQENETADTDKDDVPGSVEVETLSLHCILWLLVPLAQNISMLTSLDGGRISKFLDFTIKLCFTITAEHSLNRPMFLNGLVLFRSIINSFSDLLSSDGSYLINTYDPQMISIISSAINCGADTDSLYSAYAFGCLFAILIKRPDLMDNVPDRICGLLKKAMLNLKERSICWNEEDVENLVLLAILVGFCNLIKKYKNSTVFLQIDADIMSVLNFNVRNCIKSMSLGTTERNIKSSLTSHDRLLLLEHHINENTQNCYDLDEINLILRYSLLIEMSTELCLAVKNVFQILSKTEEDTQVDYYKDTAALSELFQSIFLYGISEKEVIAVECLYPLLSTQTQTQTTQNEQSLGLLNRFALKFLTNHFNEFDAGFGFAVFKGLLQLTVHNDTSYQFIFNILKKLVTVCQMDLDANYRKEFLLHLKKLFLPTRESESESELELLKSLSNETILELISLSKDKDSQFIQQIVFFSISANPTSFWNSKVLQCSGELLIDLLNHTESIEAALNYWILLVKSHSKLPSEAENSPKIESLNIDLNFESFYSLVTFRVKESFNNQTNRSSQLDQVWSRYFDLALNICENSNNAENDGELKAFLITALGSLNDFK